MDNNETIDFEGTMQTPPAGNSTNTNVEEPTNLNGNPTSENITGVDNTSNETKPVEKQIDNSPFEYEGEVYNYDDKGNIVDSKGNIFKTADEAKEFMDGLVDENEIDTTGDFNMKNIINTVGIELYDNDNNPIEFTNDIKGLKEYIQGVIDTKVQQAEEATLNKFFEENPYSRDFANYVAVNGTPKGFDQIRDSRGLSIDPENEQMQREIIKYAAEVFGNKSINDNYINYLKETGVLYDEAQRQLEAVLAKEANDRKIRQEERDKQEREYQESLVKFWENIKSTINSEKLGNYKLPKTVIRNVEGKKIKGDLADFYSYISKKERINDEEITRYDADLRKMSQEKKLEDDLLKAWLVYTGGSYKDLVDMAIKEEQVKKLVSKAKLINSKSMPKLKSKEQNKLSDSDIIFE